MATPLGKGAPFFPGPPARRPSGRRRLLVALAIALGSGFGILAVIVLVMFFGNAAAHCPPPDFPAYPNAQSTDFNYTFGGSTTDCTAGWEADATPEQVASFYSDAFSSGSWELASQDKQSGRWFFRRRSDPSTTGTIQFLGHGNQTRIEIEIMTGQSASPSTSRYEAPMPVLDYWRI